MVISGDVDWNADRGRKLESTFAAWQEAVRNGKSKFHFYRGKVTSLVSCVQGFFMVQHYKISGNDGQLLVYLELIFAIFQGKD